MIQKITYENKEALQNDETIEEIHKVTDENMNEIKEVVNAHADDIERVESDVTKILNNQTTQDAKITALEEETVALKQENAELKQNLDNVLISRTSRR